MRICPGGPRPASGGAHPRGLSCPFGHGNRARQLQARRWRSCRAFCDRWQASRPSRLFSLTGSARHPTRPVMENGARRLEACSGYLLRHHGAAPCLSGRPRGSQGVRKFGPAILPLMADQRKWVFCHGGGLVFRELRGAERSPSAPLRFPRTSTGLPSLPPPTGRPSGARTGRRGPGQGHLFHTVQPLAGAVWARGVAPV